MKLLLTAIIIVILAISITALIIAARPRSFDITNDYVKFPLLEQGTSFYNGASIGVSANDNFAILDEYMVNKKVYIAAFYNDKTTDGTSLVLSVSKEGGPFENIPLTLNTFDLLEDNIDQSNGLSFQYRYGKIENFTGGMCFSLEGLSSNITDSKENNFTVLINNGDFDDSFKILKEKNGENFSKISFGKEITIYP